eukprot:764598-Prymnesium_polylepis.1
MLVGAAHAAHTEESETYFYPQPQYLKQLAACATGFTFTGWGLFIFSGTPLARSVPLWVGDVVGLLALLNAACHVAIGYVIYTNRPWGLFQPTEYSERRRDTALGK